MNISALSKKIELLPLEKRQQVEDFVNFLNDQYASSEKALAAKRKANRGIAKGTISISADFDEPLTDFEDYR